MLRSVAFLEELWRLQKAAGLTDTQLAREIHHERTYLSRLRSGAVAPHISFDFACKAAERFPSLASFFPQQNPSGN